MKPRIIHIAAGLLLLSAAACFVACRKQGIWRVSEGSVWHTTYRIVYNAPVALDDSIQEVFNRVESSLSPFDGGSLISRINRCETDSTDSMIRRVFAVAQRVNRASEGRFDPTVSPLVNLWGFGYDSKAREFVEGNGMNDDFVIPQEQLQNALSLVGLDGCRIENGRMIKKHEATTFNFSAVTKGFGCDEVAAMLRRNGASDFMVEIGGEIALAGKNPKGGAWRIQIDSPADALGHEALKVITPTDGGVATSGNYRNFHDTRRYGRVGHTIDPRTGMPAVTDVASATVVAPSAALADAFATAAMAGGSRQAMEMISGADSVECMIVVATERPDSFAVLQTPGFPE